MRKRIIHITLGKANPNRANGVNKVVDSLIKAQVERGVDSSLYGITFNPTHNYPSRTYKTYLFKDKRVKFFIDWQLKRLLSSVDSESTVFHLHGAFLPQLHRVARLLVKHNVPYIFTPHGGYNIAAMQKSKFRKKLYIKMFERYIVRHAKAIQILGESEKEGLDNSFNYAEAVLIPNGQECIQGIEKKQSSTELKLCFLGRLDIRTKGLDILIDAVRILSDCVPIHLNIIGKGNDLKSIESLINEHNLHDKVSLVGPKFGTDKYSLLAEADALCLISRNEGLPGCVLEASAVGTPCIISKPTNLQSYIQQYDSGYNLQEYSADALAKLILNVFWDKKNQLLNRKSQNAEFMIKDAFSWNNISILLDDIYN